jgi:hypothetical protein
MTENGSAKWSKTTALQLVEVSCVCRSKIAALAGRKSELGPAGRVAERDEHLEVAALDPSHGGPDLGGTPRVAVFVAQPLEDPLGRVALLGRGRLVVDQDLLDHRNELAELGFGRTTFWR